MERALRESLHDAQIYAAAASPAASPSPQPWSEGDTPRSGACWLYYPEEDGVAEGPGELAGDGGGGGGGDPQGGARAQRDPHRECRPNVHQLFSGGVLPQPTR